MSTSDCNVGTSSSSFGIQILRVLDEPETKWIFCLITYNTVIIYYLCGWVTSTNSIALSAYVNIVFFNILALMVCLISTYVSSESSSSEKSRGKLITRYSENFHILKNVEEGNNHKNCSFVILGSQKYEVFALLVSSTFVIFAGFFVAIEISWRLKNQPNINTGRLGLGALLGFLAHLGTILIYPDAGMNNVVCMALPCVTLRGYNPILGINILSAIVICVTHCVIHVWDLHIVDTAAAFAVIGLTATSMLPLTFYTLAVIMKKVPLDMTKQLDRCLQEALNIDGVLEFRNERFWMKSFGKLAGSLEVRIRRNANEDHVLKNVMKCVSRLVSCLHVQEFREVRISSGVTTKEYHPAEYYIGEILEPRDGNHDTCTREWDSRWKDSIVRNVRVMKIDEVLSMNTINVGTFANVRDDIEGVGIIREPSSSSLDNVKVNYFLKNNFVKENRLLFGTKINFDCFKFQSDDIDRSLSLR